MMPEVVLDAYRLFLESPVAQSNVRLPDNLRTTLRRQILPCYGFKEEELRQDLEGCLAKVSLHQFRNAERKFKEVIEQLEENESISYGSVRNYRSAFYRFWNWSKEQTWFGSLPVPPEEITTPTDRAPSMQTGTSIARSRALEKERKETFEFIQPKDVNRYGFQERELPDDILDQLDHLARFWTDPEVKARKGPAMPLSKFNRVKVGIQCFLGWLDAELDESQEKLSLEPFIDLERLQAFIDWGKSEYDKSDNWAVDVAKVALVVAKGLNPQSKRQDFKDIPEVKVLHKYVYNLEIETKEKLKHYSFIDVTDLPERLLQEYQQWHGFWTEIEKPERKAIPLGQRSTQTYTEAIRCFFGWLKNIEGVESNTFRLAQIADLDLLKKFIAWTINVRENGYGWASNVGYAALSVAKWLNPQSKRKDFSDIEQVGEIREYVGYLREQHRHEESRQNLEEKRVSFHELQRVIEHLKQSCNPRDKYGGKRSESARRKAWRRYIFVAILTYCPVRQRELRELELGKTLFREADGYWVKLNQEQHKAGRKSRKGREYPLPKHLTADIDEWLQKWRSQVPTDHNLVFIRVGSNRDPSTLGQPMNANDVSKMVQAAVYSATAKLFDEPRKTTPHVFRRIAITYQRRHGRPEQKEALAEMMGHTVAEADRTYNEESLREKSQRAENWWDPSPSAQPTVSAPVESAPRNWIEEDEIELQHLSTSSRSHEPLRHARDQVILVLWALQELNWAQMHRIDIGDLEEQNGGYLLSVLQRSQPRTVFLKKGIAQVIQRYLKVREDCEEVLTDDSPLLIGVGHRSGGARLSAWSVRFIVHHHLGPVGSLSAEANGSSVGDVSEQEATEAVQEEQAVPVPKKATNKTKKATQSKSRQKNYEGQLSLFDLMA